MSARILKKVQPPIVQPTIMPRLGWAVVVGGGCERRVGGCVGSWVVVAVVPASLELDLRGPQLLCRVRVKAEDVQPCCVMTVSLYWIRYW